MVATNQQFIEIAQLKVQSLEGLKSIKGWGRGKMERYGPQLVKFLKAFYEKNGGKKEEKAEDLPF